MTRIALKIAAPWITLSIAGTFLGVACAWIVR